MKVLLDTCTFLWAISSPDDLGKTARDIIASPGNTVFLSAVSSWEICVKYALGNLSLSEHPATYIPKYRVLQGYEELPLDEASTLHLQRLPVSHRDPFDRMLVCQAIEHGLVIVTPDPMIAQYPVKVAW